VDVVKRNTPQAILVDTLPLLTNAGLPARPFGSATLNHRQRPTFLRILHLSNMACSLNQDKFIAAVDAKFTHIAPHKMMQAKMMNMLKANTQGHSQLMFHPMQDSGVDIKILAPQQMEL
jgi:hypothetical protein